MPGRAAILRLDGPGGSLDVVCVYMYTGNAQDERAGLRAQLAAKLRPSAACLAVMAGDWNWVAEAEDRASKATAAWSGACGSAEQRLFEERVADPFGFCELEQEVGREPYHPRLLIRKFPQRATG